MPEQKHLEILKQGVEEWNQWREKNFFVFPDLTEARLYGANLNGANLSLADLIEADLVEADLTGADLGEADLTEARLIGANLIGANLYRTRLGGADLTEATIGWTIFADVDLSTVKGLDTVFHRGPSSIGIDTLCRSRGIPDRFLRGAGVPDQFIEYIASLVGKAIEYYSCFISYSSENRDFAERLHADLQSKNVHCWIAPHDMRIGDEILDTVDKAIHRQDKVLLVLSAASIGSGWVEREVKIALARELREKRKILFPIRIDDAVMNAEAAWASLIRENRHIGDLCQWKDHDAYQKAFERLLQDLKADDATWQKAPG